MLARHLTLPCLDRQIEAETSPDRFDRVEITAVRRKPNTLQASVLINSGNKQEGLVVMPNLASGDALDSSLQAARVAALDVVQRA